MKSIDVKKQEAKNRGISTENNANTTVEQSSNNKLIKHDYKFPKCIHEVSDNPRDSKHLFSR